MAGCYGRLLWQVAMVTNKVSTLLKEETKGDKGRGEDGRGRRSGIYYVIIVSTHFPLIKVPDTLSSEGREGGREGGHPILALLWTLQQHKASL